ncbi:MAG: hypothetical protein JKY96_05490 [Phycisphaerales bacterium]|nr:hypothetical protein [Phycisphaerales bacterium]
MARKANKFLKRSTAFVLGAMMLAGVLIWAKLRLVIDIPRSAYAEPDESLSSGDPLKSDTDADLEHEPADPLRPNPSD